VEQILVFPHYVLLDRCGYLENMILKTGKSVRMALCSPEEWLKENAPPGNHNTELELIFCDYSQIDSLLRKANSVEWSNSPYRDVPVIIDVPTKEIGYTLDSMIGSSLNVVHYFDEWFPREEHYKALIDALDLAKSNGIVNRDSYKAALDEVRAKGKCRFTKLDGQQKPYHPPNLTC